jgi:uncharacterized membrane protein
MKTKQRIIYGITAFGGAIGLVASFLEVLEYQELLKNSHAILTCDLNSVFSCSSVLNAWQSKVFGFPNSMMCLVFFTLMLSTALVGLTGGVLARKFRLTMQAIALFFLCFALWFLWESTYQIRALCILCIFCFGGLLLLNWGWLRINASDFPIGKGGRKKLAQITASGMDIFGWVLLGIIVAFAMIMRFS